MTGARFAPLDDVRRQELLHRFTRLHSGREKPGRYWRIDLEKIEIPQNRADYKAPHVDAPQIRGGFVTDILSAAREHSDLFAAAYGRAVKADDHKFAALAAAYCNTGVFIYIPADVDVADPVVITYRAGERALFPYTLVFAERGARCTIVERIEAEDATQSAFVCGISEIIAGENSCIDFVCEQNLPDDATGLFTRGAAPGKDATLQIGAAHLGAHLALDAIDTHINHPGADVQMTALFFPGGTQHVDVTTTAWHNAGESQSQTLVKSAATGSGQARYLGNIRIAPHAQATESALRDDALLLSKRAHIDSVPALEIAANDVKAYHGATVGALDEEQIFYMVSRGIERSEAERMIALGFFEPAIERFPTQALRERLRFALEQRTGA